MGTRSGGIGGGGGVGSSRIDPDDVNERADFVHTVNDVGHFLGTFKEPNTNTHRETGHMSTREVGSGD